LTETNSITITNNTTREIDLTFFLLGHS